MRKTWLIWIPRSLVLMWVLFLVLVWLRNSDFPNPVYVQLAFGWALEAPVWEVIFWPFVIGAVIGWLGAWLRMRQQTLALREELVQERQANDQLEAANRALEASVPILRAHWEEALEA